MKLSIIAGAVSLSIAGTAAHAADAIVAYDPPVAAPFTAMAYDWNGAYVGATAGYVFDYGTKATAYDAFGDSFSERYLTGSEGFVGGFFAGYNHTIDSVLLGVEADIEYADTSSTRSTFRGFAETGVDSGFQGSLRARLGYTIDRTLVFATAGVSVADKEYTVVDPTGAFSNDSTRVGYTLGAGLEHAVTDQILIRGEYRYADYGDEDINTGAATYNFDSQTHALKAGVAYKF